MAIRQVDHSCLMCSQTLLELPAAGIVYFPKAFAFWNTLLYKAGENQFGSEAHKMSWEGGISQYYSFVWVKLQFSPSEVFNVSSSSLPFRQEEGGKGPTWGLPLLWSLGALSGWGFTASASTQLLLLSHLWLFVSLTSLPTKDQW